jgi:L-rhamnose isomerase
MDVILTNMSTISTIEREKEDLGVHVDICAQRYQSLDDRLDKVEKKVDEVKKTVETFKVDLTKTLVATAGTIVVALIGCAGIIINHIK